MMEKFCSGWLHVVAPIWLAYGVGLVDSFGAAQAMAGEARCNEESYTAFVSFFGLSPAEYSLDDDPDQDGLSNFKEFCLGTDPLVADTDRDGLVDGQDQFPVDCAYIPWGDPYFTQGDDVDYTWPPFMVAAFKRGFIGKWAVQPPAWHVAADEMGVATLLMEVDRTLLPGDALLNLAVVGDRSATLWMDLYDRDETILAANLGGNLLENLGTNTTCVVSVPFSRYPTAVGICLRRGTGEITVYECLLYADPAATNNEAGVSVSPGSASSFSATGSSSERGVTGSSTQDAVQSGEASLTSEPEGRTLYVDQAVGDDTFSGLAAVRGGGHGPKKTIKSAWAVIRPGSTLIIKSGTYRESLNISGKKVKVVIQGKVRL